MKRTGIFLCTAFLLFSLTSCSNSAQGGQQNTQSANSRPSVMSVQTSAEADQTLQNSDSSQSENGSQTENGSQIESGSQTEE
ncbi:MAG: hypothetical protein K2K41_02775, partial [Ruminiclostridium sp.]|nr:hypothetical protein [Ruminiclostridium sp.]